MNKKSKVFSTLHPSGLNRKQRRQAAKFSTMQTRSRRISQARLMEFYRRNGFEKPKDVAIEVISDNVEEVTDAETL